MLSLDRSTIKLDEKRVYLEVEDTLGPLRSLCHSVHRNQFGLSEIPAPALLDRHRLSTEAGSLRPFSIRYRIPVKAKISIVTRRRCRAGKIFVSMRLFFRQEDEKTRKEELGQMRQTRLTVEVAPQGPRSRGIPQGCDHFVNSRHCSRKTTFARLSWGGEAVRAADRVWCPRHLHEQSPFFARAKKAQKSTEYRDTAPLS